MTSNNQLEVTGQSQKNNFSNRYSMAAKNVYRKDTHVADGPSRILSAQFFSVWPIPINNSE